MPADAVRPCWILLLLGATYDAGALLEPIVHTFVERNRVRSGRLLVVHILQQAGETALDGAQRRSVTEDIQACDQRREYGLSALQRTRAIFRKAFGRLRPDQFR